MGSRRKSSKRERANRPSSRKQEAPNKEVGQRRRLLSGWRLVCLLVVLLLLAVAAVTRFGSDHYLKQGAAALRIHRFQQADRCLQRAAICRWRGAEVALLRSRLAWVQGDLAASEAHLQVAARRGAVPSTVKQERTLMKVRDGSAVALRSRLPSMLQTFPDQGPAILEAFTAGFLARGDADQASEILAIWQDADATDPRVDYWQGVTKRAFGKPSHAIAHFQSGLKKSPEMTVARLALAETLRSHFFYRQALAHYRRVLRQQSDSVKAELGLGICLLKTGAADEGIAQLQSVIAKHPDNISARRALAQQFQDQGDSQQVVDTVAAAIDQHANDISLHYLLATAYRRLDEGEKSDGHFDTFQRLNRQLETTQLLTKEYQQQPSASLARQIAGSLMQCKWQDAGKWIFKALADDPQDIEMHRLMAEFLRRSGRSADAERYEQNLQTLSASGPLPQ